MNLKEFDYKQFMLEKGERVGLGVAVSLMVLMLIFSLFMPKKGFFSGSPSKNAEALSSGSKQLDSALNTAQPSESQLPGEAKGRLIKLDTVALDPRNYFLEPIIPSERGDNPTRRPPNILNIAESAVAPAFIPVDTYIFNKDFSTIVVLRDKEGRAGGGPPAGGAKGGNPMMGMYGRGIPPMGSGAGGAGGSGNPMMQQMMQQMRRMQFGASRSGGNIIGAEEKPEYETQIVKLTNLDPNAHLARQLRPVRMAIIAGSFPYKAQLEEFKNKLHKSSIQEVLEEGVDEGKGTVAAFRFLGLKVERKEVDANGKDLSKWAELPLKEFYSQWLLNSGLPFEPDDPKYDLVKPLDGLVMPRLREFRDEAPPNPAGMMGPSAVPTGFPGANVAREEPRKAEDTKYPDVEKNLQKIAETLTKLEGVKPKQIARVPERFRKNKDFDPFNSSVPTGEEQPADANTPKPNESAEGATVPEYCLARVVDVTIDPGKFYRYRVKVRMANPNYGRADVASPSYKEGKELESKDWFEIPQTVSVPEELHYYVCDQKQISKDEARQHPAESAIKKAWLTDPSSKDRQVVFQLHRWVETTPIVPNGEPVPVAEWAIADRVIVARGEFVGQPVKVDVPVWKYTQDAFVLPAEDQKIRRKGKVQTGVTINFGPDNEDNNTILVDFDGPRHYREFTGQGPDGQPKTLKIDDTTGIEVLMLSPEGKLLAHNSLADTNDKARVDRRKEVMDRIQRVREGKSGGLRAPGGGLDAPGGKSQ